MIVLILVLKGPIFGKPKKEVAHAEVVVVVDIPEKVVRLDV